MTTPKVSPLVEVLEIPVMLILDHFFFRQWFPPVISAVTAGVVVGLISGAFYLRVKKKPPTRMILFIVIAVLLSIFIKL